MVELEKVIVRNNHQREKISSKDAGYKNTGFSYPTVKEETHPMKKKGEWQKAAMAAILQSTSSRMSAPKIIAEFHRIHRKTIYRRPGTGQ